MKIQVIARGAVDGSPDIDRVMDCAEADALDLGFRYQDVSKAILTLISGEALSAALDRAFGAGKYDDLPGADNERNSGRLTES